MSDGATIKIEGLKADTRRADIKKELKEQFEIEYSVAWIKFHKGKCSVKFRKINSGRKNQNHRV